MQTTQPTTRQAISEQDFLEENLKEDFETDFPREIEHLNELVRRSLGDLTPSSHTAFADMECQTDDLSFRLVSWTLPARPISLMPAHYTSVPHQRPVEDTPHEAAVRQFQAQEAAVDLDRISRVALFNATSDISRSGNGGELTAPVSSRHFVATKVSGLGLKKLSAQLPNLLLTERDKPQVASSKVGGEDRWKAKVKCCEILPILADSDSHPKRKRKKRSHPKERQLPRFFRPMQEWGGKSAGYAMGWRASWPSHKPGSNRYFRDSMRRGVLMQIK
ncbi:hypothetical protein BU17DRAFT_93680 [Hysterangium stoloniferum]|nr:hypothetical protein BU17DRAFT_93680 [Hysterangium stoloniferum]